MAGSLIIFKTVSVGKFVFKKLYMASIKESKSATSAAWTVYETIFPSILIIKT